jgi:penicillin-insensitive murein endopeptidase
MLSLGLLGCLGTPTPLAPGVRGSVGLPYHGVLTEPVELPIRGTGFQRYRPYGERNYGTHALVTAISRAASRVQSEAADSPPLVVGDLSAKWGGKVSGHASHRTGRDVDLLFYATTLAGTPIRSPGFIHFGADTLARTAEGNYVALDIRRQWLLVRALLEDPAIDVLWMFVSRDVEAYLIAHARSLGEPLDLVLKAERVLHQPRDSANHDDHIHLRIGCTEAERVAGCSAGGPAWPWISQPIMPETQAFLPWDLEPIAEEPLP